MSKRPTVLMILDGYGLNDRKEANAIAEANTPVMDKLMAEYPYVKGNASGLAVGLPDGQMGNSEVGHMNMGAGRIVYQELTRITKEIQDGDFFKNEVEPRFGTKYDDYEEYVKNNIIGGEDVDIVIVQSMLLTGFDAPSLGVLYVDKPMKEHSLLQAIARVNRIAAGKDFGLIVDYWGLFGNLNNAMEMYSDDQSGLSGYDPADIAESIVTAAEGQEKLKEAHKALWNFFGDVTFDQNNPRAWVAFFEKEDAAESEKLRKEFYEKLAAFSKMMTMAVGNYSLYQSIGFDQMQNYKADLLFFQKLRSALMMVYAEKVDFSKYEDGIRSLLNTFVTSEAVEIVVEPVAIHDKAAMDKQLEEVEGQKAKAAYIHTRIVSELESRRYEDPMLFKRFSERIRETIAEYRRSRDENIYLASMKRMAR